jgi:hypothetical protein
MAYATARRAQVAQGHNHAGIFDSRRAWLSRSVITRNLAAEPVTKKYDSKCQHGGEDIGAQTRKRNGQKNHRAQRQKKKRPRKNLREYKLKDALRRCGHPPYRSKNRPHDCEDHQMKAKAGSKFIKKKITES